MPAGQEEVNWGQTPADGEVPRVLTLPGGAAGPQREVTSGYRQKTAVRMTEVSQNQGSMGSYGSAFVGREAGEWLGERAKSFSEQMESIPSWVNCNEIKPVRKERKIDETTHLSATKIDAEDPESTSWMLEEKLKSLKNEGIARLGFGADRPSL